jgi:hypothetical protein
MHGQQGCNAPPDCAAHVESACLHPAATCYSGSHDRHSPQVYRVKGAVLLRCRPQQGPALAAVPQQPAPRRGSGAVCSPGGGHYQRYSLEELQAMAQDPRAALPIMAGQGEGTPRSLASEVRWGAQTPPQTARLAHAQVHSGLTRQPHQQDQPESEELRISPMLLTPGLAPCQLPLPPLPATPLLT